MRHRMLVLFVLLILLPLCGERTQGRRATINASSCSRTDVGNAVAAAVDGDVVQIPAGSCNWSSGIFLNKSITIQGAGMDVTTITNTQTPSGGILPPLIDWNTKATGNNPAGFTKLANLTFNGGSGSEGGSQVPMLHFSGNSGRVLIFQVKIIETRQESLKFTGNVRGVFHGGVLLDNGHFGVSIRVEHTTWGDSSSTCSSGGCGDKSWSEPSSMGTDQAVVFENSYFESTTGGGNSSPMLDGWNGMRVVWRYNTMVNANVGNHGTETGGRFRSVRHMESYRNTLTFNGGTFIDVPFGSRGGTGFHFDNFSTFAPGSGYNNSFVLNTYRSDPPDNATRQTYWPWGRCGSTSLTSITRSGTTATVTTNGWDGRGHWLHDGSGFGMPRVIIAGASDGLYNGTFVVASVLNDTQFTYTMSGTPAANASGTLTMAMQVDGNSDSTGYRCLDQIGAGQQTGLFNGDSPNPAGITQALEPYYIWNNTRDGTLDHAVERNGPDSMVENRDYYNHNTSFTGATGIGRGTIGARPATCSTGVGYWATNEGEWDSTNGGTTDGRFYKCTSTNTWTLFYTPLAYPHPLLAPQEVETNITGPTTNDHYDTQAATVTITGVATDNSAVTGSTWVNGGSNGSCTGTTSYSCANIPLSVGVNTITVTTSDDTGHEDTDQLLVQRLATGASPPSDNFNRTDWPTLGAWWTHQGGTPSYAIVNNRAVGTGTNFDCSFWNQEVVDDDQFSEATIGFVADTNNATRVSVRASGTSSLFNAYFLSTDGLSGSGHTFIGKFIAGALTTLQAISTTFAPGDVMRLEVEGNTLRAYKNGVQVGTDQASGSELTTGQPGQCFYGAGSALDSFSAGDLEEGQPEPPASTIPRLRIRGQER